MNGTNVATEPSTLPAPGKTGGLTIVIVNWNGGEKLIRCLRSIRDSQVSFPLKIIVVDNDSADGSREQATAEFPEFTIVNTGANLGFGRGNNYARPWVDTPLVLFLNPDTELFPDTLEKAVVTLLARPRVGLLGCQMRDPDGTVQELGLQWFPTPSRVFLELVIPGLLRKGPWSRWLRHDPRQSASVKKLYGGFFLFRKEVLDVAGWFDERYFMYAEDVDLCHTVRQLGWELYYTADCAIIHAYGGASQNASGSFSTLMKLQSIHQYICKYYGTWAGRRYRFAVGVAAGMRWIALRIAQWFSLPNQSELRAWENARQRSQWMWQWAWQGRQANVPGRNRTQERTAEPTAIRWVKGA